MKTRKTITMTVTVSVPKGMSAAEASDGDCRHPHLGRPPH